MINFFRQIRRKLADDNQFLKYSRYAIGEIALVVVGILIALQVNNWNQQRLKDARFEFGLEALYSEIQGSLYIQSGIEDRLQFQIQLIDSILHYPDSIGLHRIPSTLVILDESGLISWDNNWKREYLETDITRTDRNFFVNALQGLTSISSNVEQILETNQLTDAFKGYLKKHHIPYRLYYKNAGTNYKDFVASSNEDDFSEKQLSLVKELLNDESLRADLQTLEWIKLGMLDYTRGAGVGAKTFLNYIQSNSPGTDYSLKQMEIIGTGLAGGQWGTGIKMRRTDPADDSRWEIEQEFVEGKVKFRTDASWMLDWGRGQINKNKLVFKGGDIPVTPGLYSIKIDILKGFYQFERIE